VTIAAQISPVFLYNGFMMHSFLISLRKYQLMPRLSVPRHACLSCSARSP
jgi:hypothetical protein